jgi:ABC-2 type transport system ATP-binding protein
MTVASQVLMIEVDEGSDQLRDELARRGLDPRPYERALLVRLERDATYDAVRDAVADLGLPLNRLEQQRRHVEELFRDDQGAPGAQEPGGEQLEASHVS